MSNRSGQVAMEHNNKVKAVLTGYNQPTKRQKTIEVRNKMYNLKFE